MHLLKAKGDAYDALVNFVQIAETQHNKKVKNIKSDNTLEFEEEMCKIFFEQQ